jgi:hypothetical protein
MTFETRPRGDPHELADRSDPIEWTEILLDIERQLYHLENLLTLIISEQVALNTAGVYPAVPTLFWDNDPNGQPRYAKLSFPVDALPSGQRKLYIGCKESKITEAKQKIARTRRFEALKEERVRLERFLRMTRADLDRVARQVAGYRVPDDLGLDLAGEEASAGPKTVGDVAKLVVEQGEWLRVRPKVEYTEMQRHEPEFKSKREES